VKNILKTYGPNFNGRDFVIGDLHGGYPAFQNLVREIHFDPFKDRIFSTSDLVDRGPNSYECLQLLREPWFCCSNANHEQMMFEAFNGGWMGKYWLRNGGGWGLEALTAHNKRRADPAFVIDDKSADIIDLVNLAGELPFMMTLNHKNGKKFHFIHAELPSSRSAEVDDEMLADPEKVYELATTQAADGDTFLWGRYVFMPFYGIHLTKEKVVRSVKGRHIERLQNENRSMIISGHTIMTQPLTIMGQTNIDTCAYGSCNPDPDGWEALTCIELDTWTFYQATPTTFKVVEPLTVNKEDLEDI